MDAYIQPTTRALATTQVEACFYRELAPQLLSERVCAVPQPLSVQCSAPGSLQLLITDLRPDYPVSTGDLSLPQVQ